MEQLQTKDLTEDKILEENFIMNIITNDNQIEQIKIKKKIEEKCKELGILKTFSEIYKILEKKYIKEKKGKEKKQQIYFEYVNYNQDGTITPKPVEENLRSLLDYYNLKPRYNEMTKELEIGGFSDSCEDNKEEVALIQLYSKCLHHEFKSMTKALVADYTLSIGDNNRYNPAKEYLQSCYEKYKKDILLKGLSEFQKLLQTIKTSEDFNQILKETLIKKWMISCVEAMYSDNGIRSQGVLTLKGGQGKGKTSWFKNLFPNDKNFFKDGESLDPNDKDSVIKVIKYWCVELGELETTLKKDLERLKGWLTSQKDEIRRPFARKESKFPRRTIFCATVNSDRFLRDETGNRRWWVIPVEEIDYNHKINIDLLWAEIVHLHSLGEKWHLTAEEDTLLSASNKEFETLNWVDTVLETNFDWDNPERFWLSAGEIISLLGPDKNINLTNLPIALKKRGVKQSEKRVKNTKKYLVPKMKNVINWEFKKADEMEFI